MALGEVSARRLALLVEYEGTNYRGSQHQENAPTVQGSLERALSSLTGEPIRVALAGRTDAGVHARGQVASFSTRSRHSAATFERGVNALLPPDICVRAAAEVPLTFNPRRDAVSRWYRYRLHVGRQRPALLRRLAWHVSPPPDAEAMEAAAALLPGRHDFAAFTQPSRAATMRTQRLVTAARLARCRDVIVFDMEADAYLPQMVRRIVGALVEVGLGRLPLAGFQALLREARPGSASFAAPPRGLCLMKVSYESGLFDDETDENL